MPESNHGEIELKKAVYALSYDEGFRHVHEHCKDVTTLDIGWATVYLGRTKEKKAVIFVYYVFVDGPYQEKHSLLISDNPPVSIEQGRYLEKTSPWVYLIDGPHGFLGGDSEVVERLFCNWFECYFGVDHAEEAYLTIEDFADEKPYVLLLRNPRNEVDAWSERSALVVLPETKLEGGLAMRADGEAASELSEEI